MVSRGLGEEHEGFKFVLESFLAQIIVVHELARSCVPLQSTLPLIP
jgi:hypothetical protein